MIRRVFLLQTEIGHPDPWDDSINMVNTSVNPGLGISNNPARYDNYISFFQRVDNRFSLSHSVYSESHIVLKRPFSIHDPNTEVPINFDDIAKHIVDWDINDERYSLPDNFDFYVHSQNPIGKANIEGLLNNYLRIINADRI